MAKVTLHPAFGTLSGKSGNLVYRRVNEATVMAVHAPITQRKPTAAQLAQRDRFRLAGEYASRVLSDPWQRRAYEILAAQRKRRADKLIASDFLTPPVVESIELSEYQRQRGDVIRVFATDDIEVVSVTVIVRLADGTVVEQGIASKVHGVWRYEAQGPASRGVPLTVIATATDRPGNEGTLSATHS